MELALLVCDMGNDVSSWLWEKFEHLLSQDILLRIAAIRAPLVCVCGVTVPHVGLI